MAKRPVPRRLTANHTLCMTLRQRCAKHAAKADRIGGSIAVLENVPGALRTGLDNKIARLLALEKGIDRNGREFLLFAISHESTRPC